MNDTNNSDTFLITTIDNPFNPFTQPDEWYSFDKTYGYNTYQNVVSLGSFTNDMTADEEKEEYIKAMEKLLKLHPMYIKVFENSNIGDKMKNLREIFLKDSLQNSLVKN